MNERLEVSEEEARAIRRALIRLDRKEGRVPAHVALERLATQKRELRVRQGKTAGGAA